MTSLSTIVRGHAPLVAFLALAMLPAPAGAQGEPAAEPAAPELSPLSVDLPPPLARVLTDYESAWEKKDGADGRWLIVSDMDNGNQRGR